MKYIVKDSLNKLMVMEVVSSVPQLPLGYEILGLAEDLPEAIAEIQAAVIVESAKSDAKAFLASSDWKVLRHIRQIALNETLSLSAEEYLALEGRRSAAASSI